MKHAGFTLIEVVVALGILALSIAGLLSLLTSSQNRIGKSMEEWKNMHMLAQAAEYAVQNGFSVSGLEYSPIKGPEGNIEFLLFVRHNGKPSLDEEAVDRVVKAAHETLDGVSSRHRG